MRSVRTKSSLGLATVLTFGTSVGCSPRGGASPLPAERAAAKPPSGSEAPPDLRGRPPAERAEALLQRMTLPEKIDYIGGDRNMHIRAVPRLGIPEIKMSDGPVGCRNWGPSTAYPATVGIAGAFDPSLSEQVGRAMARDCRARGVHILLAPGVNIHRSPLAGRNFEYRGEDPHLAGQSAVAFIRGVQGEGVLATVKHFAANNQEWDRNRISSETDERTLREIYFPAFEQAVRTGAVGSVMTAYNLLNGTYCSHHSWLLNTVLKTEWGFRGIVMSDWGAVHDALGAVTGGCDLEMPSGKFMNQEALTPLLTERKIDVALIDEKVRRILRTIAEAGFLDEARPAQAAPSEDPNSTAVALESARRSIVLLKNAGALLPLDAAKLQRVAVIGPNVHPAVVGGSGSAFVTPLRVVSLLDGLKQSLPSVELLHHPGMSQPSETAALGRPCFSGPVKQQVFAGTTLSGKLLAESSVDRIDFLPNDSPQGKGIPAYNYSIRWSGEVTASSRGAYKVVTNTDDGVRVRVDGKVVIDDWTQHAPKTNTALVELTPGQHSVVVEYYQGEGGARAQFGFQSAADAARAGLEGGSEVTAIARKADAVVIGVGFGQTADTNSVRSRFEGFWPPEWARKTGLVESEDSDRPFELPPAQVETIRLAAAANPRTVVIVNAGSAVDLQPFLNRVPALLWAWYPGQEGGQALADVLLGKVNPSAKLPVTFAKRYADYPSAPFYSLNQEQKTPYTEGVFVGYRGFDTTNTEPAFPFGHGLSYTRFEYANARVSALPDGGAEVSFDVRNVGDRAGAEAAQVYVAPPKGDVPRPPKELKGFTRLELSAKESKRATVRLSPRAFAFWHPAHRHWKVAAGAYEILIGASSRDIRLRDRVAVSERSLPK